MGTQLNAKIDGVGTQLNAKVAVTSDQLNTKIDGVGNQLNNKIETVKDAIASAKVWALTLYAALAAAMLGTLARGFGWV
jgi:hypothetical protein